MISSIAVIKFSLGPLPALNHWGVGAFDQVGNEIGYMEIRNSSKNEGAKWEIAFERTVEPTIVTREEIVFSHAKIQATSVDDFYTNGLNCCHGNYQLIGHSCKDFVRAVFNSFDVQVQESWFD